MNITNSEFEYDVISLLTKIVKQGLLLRNFSKLYIQIFLKNELIFYRILSDFVSPPYYSSKTCLKNLIFGGTRF